MPVKDAQGGKRRRKAADTDEDEITEASNHNASNINLDVSLAREDEIDASQELPPGALRWDLLALTCSVVY